MTNPGRSLSAAINAEFRARESQRPANERLIDDPWAARFRDDHWRLRALRRLERAIPALRRLSEDLQLAHCMRHRSVEELVLRAIANGCRQVVTIGPGYDSRAARLRSDSVRWFEIDRPAVQERKARLAADWPAKLIPGDANADSLARLLSPRTGFDPQQPVCFVLEGVLHYLDADGLRRLFAELAAMPQAVVVATVISSAQFHTAPSLFRAVLRWLGEIPSLHFEPEAIPGWFGERGFGCVEQWDFAAQAGGLVAGRWAGRPPALHQIVVRGRAGSYRGDA